MPEHCSIGQINLIHKRRRLINEQVVTILETSIQRFQGQDAERTEGILVILVASLRQDRLNLRSNQRPKGQNSKRQSPDYQKRLHHQGSPHVSCDD